MVSVHPHVFYATLALMGIGTTDSRYGVYTFATWYARTPAHVHALLALAEPWPGDLGSLLEVSEAPQ